MDRVAVSVLAIGLGLVPIFFLVAGLLGRREIKKAKFERRGEGGLEGFESYEAMEKTRAKEGCLWWISTILLIVGVLSLPASCIFGFMAFSGLNETTSTTSSHVE